MIIIVEWAIIYLGIEGIVLSGDYFLPTSAKTNIVVVTFESAKRAVLLPYKQPLFAVESILTLERRILPKFGYR